MGKPFESELARLRDTYEWAKTYPIPGLSSTLGLSKGPLIAVGSGGSFTVAHFAAALHQERLGQIAKAITPLQLRDTHEILREANILLLTAGGKNPDILAAFDEALCREPRRLTIVCATKASRLAQLASQYSAVEVCEFAPPSGRDGFLATNSLLATAVLLYRAYERPEPRTPGLPDTLDILLDSTRPAFDYSPLLAAETITVLYPAGLETLAVEMESKFVESALGNVQFADYRQFAHGRHHWLAKRGTRTAVLAISTPSTTDVTKRTLSLLPKDIPLIHVSLKREGPLACMEGILKIFELVRQAGMARDIDPGDPGVPLFGRKLYNLNVFSKRTARRRSISMPDIAIARKTAQFQETSGSAKRNTAWNKAFIHFLDGLRHMQVKAIVTDYDGTLCDESKRFDPLPASVAQELVRLLRAKIILGIATGRGKSVRERLQQAIPAKYWARIFVGYYNGGDIGCLCDNTKPDGTQIADEPLLPIVAHLKKQQVFLGISEIEVRRKQVTVKPGGSQNLERLWLNIQGGINPQVFPGICVLRSGHSIDILAPGVSKLSVVQRVCAEADAAITEVLCIGDQGCWPGNDHELLGVQHSLSVNATSSAPERCWNLAPIGVRESQATLGYLKMLSVTSRGIRFALPKLEKSK